MIHFNNEKLQRRIERFCKKADFSIESSDTIIPIATLVFKDSPKTPKAITHNDEDYDLSSLILSTKKCYFNDSFILRNMGTNHLFMMSITTGGKEVFEMIPNNQYFNSFVIENKCFFIIAGFNGMFGINDSIISFVEFLPNGDYIVGNVNLYIKTAIKNKKFIPISNSGFIKNKKRLISK